MIKERDVDATQCMHGVVTPLQAVAILKSQPIVVLDDEACRNAEDDEPNAVVILDVVQRDAIVSLLVDLILNRSRHGP